MRNHIGNIYSTATGFLVRIEAVDRWGGVLVSFPQHPEAEPDHMSLARLESAIAAHLFTLHTGQR